MAKSADADERDIIGEILSGDPAAIQVMDGWIDLVLRRGFPSLRAEWDDLRQETRFRVYQNLSRGRFDGRSSLRTYVHRIAKNVCIDSSRLAHRRRESSFGALGNVPPWTSDKDAGAAGVAARDILTKVLEGLSEEDRLLLSLVLGEHRSYAEVAERLGISEGAVKTRMSRCKDRVVKLGRDLLR